jgi:hypothetical protein
MTRCAGVVWLRRNVVRKDRTKKQMEQGAPKGRSFRKKYQGKPESIKEIMVRGLKKQLYLRSEKTSGRIFRNTFRLENTK